MIVNTTPHNKALQLTANPLHGLAAAELGRYVRSIKNEHRENQPFGKVRKAASR